MLLSWKSTGVSLFARLFPTVSSYHVVGVAETRLWPEIDDCLIDVRAYRVLRQDQNLGGVGIVLYVKNNLKGKILQNLKTTQQVKPLKP